MLTPIQTQASLHVYEAVSDFPKVVADLIGSYLTPDEELLSLALGPIGALDEVDQRSLKTFHPKRYVLRDKEMSAAIKYFLSSSTFDPSVKSQIIRKFLGYPNEKLPSSSIVAPHGPIAVDERYNAFNSLLDEMRTDLTSINWNWVDLSRTTLVGLRLNNISAVGADFRGSNLSKTNLRHANLSETNFSDTLVEEADLEGAVFQRSNLKAARLSRSKMRFVDLTKADFSNARLENADLEGAVFR